MNSRCAILTLAEARTGILVLVYDGTVSEKDDNLVDAFRAMLRIRRVEEAISERYSEKEMRTPVHLCVGQEGVPVGISQHLQVSDKVLSGHRSHGQYLAKGGNLNSMIAELYGREGGCSRGRGGSQHLIDLQCGFLGSAPVLGSTLAIGVGVAWALRRSAPGSVVVTYFGDAATEEGVFHEALSFASLHTLPVIFVCENNLYSTHTALASRQPDRPIADLALGHGIPSAAYDGNDMKNVLQSSRIAIDRARAGHGPTFLVYDTYRYLEHVGPGLDIHIGYRTQDEWNEWQDRDVIDRLREELRDTSADWADVERNIEDEIAAEIRHAFDFAITSPYPEALELMSFVHPPSRSADE